MYEKMVCATDFRKNTAPSQMRSKSTQSFIHIADWYTTFCKLDSVDSGPGRFPLNGVVVWSIITGETEKNTS